METTPVNVVDALTPVLNSSMTQIIDMITNLVPFMVTISLFGAGIYLVRSFISNGTRAIG